MISESNINFKLSALKDSIEMHKQLINEYNVAIEVNKNKAKEVAASLKELNIEPSKLGETIECLEKEVEELAEKAKDYVLKIDELDNG